MGSLRLKGLTKVFSAAGKEIVAVDTVDLDMPDGEFIVLVGPSGSGKSTILRMIAGLETRTDGEIRIGNTDVTNAKPKNRDIAMVFQNYALYPHLSARGNMSFGLKMKGELSRDEIEERVENAADIMSIKDLLDKMPSELSGGQKQRVALGRAIVRDPEVFLMDEPLSNLDAKLRTQMRTEIQQLQAELGVTTVYVTHDQTEAMTMGDRIAILNHGELQQFGTPIESYYKPANMFVAGFIGSPSMNFIEVEAEWTEDQLELHHPDFTYPTSQAFSEQIPETPTELVLGIRPEDIEVTDEAAPGITEVTIKVIEPLGKEQLLYFDIDDESYIASVDGHRRFSEGDRVGLHFPESVVYLFDRRSETTIKHQKIERDEHQTEEVRPDV